MAKWYGKIGYSITEETEPGLWEPKIVEREHYGDTFALRRTIDNSNEVNDNISISVRNGISIVADPFANKNFGNMLYAEFMGAKWKIKDIEVQYPRLILTLGGVYNA